jgi:2,3-bisphosphoglycerate-independent phosphoglycerate mutase
VISAVDLLNGIGRYLDLEIITVPGATGYFDTDYAAKGRYAIDALKRLDFIAVHVEATDEAGHSGNAKEKVKAIEQIDQHIVGPLVQYLQSAGPYRLYVAPDHYTPTIKKTHVAEPVPFIFSSTDSKTASGLTYTENNAAKTDLLEDGSSLMRKLIGGWSVS